MQQLLGYAAKERDDFLREVSAPSGWDVARSWCNPHDYREVVGCDVGGGCFHYHRLLKGEDAEKIPVSAAKDAILSLGPGVLLIAERAHLGTPRRQLSVSQPWPEDVLLDIYAEAEKAGVDIRLFPHHCTTKARRWAALNAPDGFVEEEKTTDINDARALAYYVMHRNGVALSKPPSSFSKSPARRYGELVISEANPCLNTERPSYSGECFPVQAEVARKIALDAPPGIRFISNAMSSFSVAALVCGQVDDRPVRYTYRGRTPGFKFWMRNVLRSSSLHFGGGTARSNLYFHRFRAFAGEYAAKAGVVLKSGSKVVSFSEHTPEQDAVLRGAWREMRSQLRIAYRSAVRHSSSFLPCELLDNTIA